MGALIGDITKRKLEGNPVTMSDATPALMIALAIFVIAFIVICFTKIEEPKQAPVQLSLVPKALSHRHFALGGSLDIQTDRSLNLYNPTFDEAGKLISYEHPSLLEQTECGISLRCEITSPLFSVGAGLGCNILGKGYDFSRIYTQYSLKHFVNSRMFIFVSYRFNSTQYTHNMMYGLGLRF